MGNIYHLRQDSSWGDGPAAEEQDGAHTSGARSLQSPDSDKIIRKRELAISASQGAVAKRGENKVSSLLSRHSMASHLGEMAPTIHGAARKRAALEKFEDADWELQQGAVADDGEQLMHTAKVKSQSRIKLRASERIVEEHDFSADQDRAEHRHVLTAPLSRKPAGEPLRDMAREYVLDRQRSLESGKGLSAAEELQKALASLGQFGDMFSRQQIDRAFSTAERLEKELLRTDHSG
jgi:hypothetical protein